MKSCKKYRYRAFGLNIESGIELPELNSTESLPEIYIRLGKTPFSLKEPVLKGVRFEVSAGHFLLSVDNIARYFVENGKNIFITGDFLHLKR